MRPFYETWQLHFNQTDPNRALVLRFNLISSANGFRRNAEIYALLFEEVVEGEVRKTVLKETHDLSEYETEGKDQIRIGSCTLGVDGTEGQIRSKGRDFSWKFQIAKNSSQTNFQFFPKPLSALVTKNRVQSVSEDLSISGESQLDGKTLNWQNAKGHLISSKGTKRSHSWVWGHCNRFVDDQGRDCPALFEGITERLRSKSPFPALSSFRFQYDGKDYEFNSLWDMIRLRSKYTLTEWQFQSDRGDLTFKGHIQAQIKDFAGLAIEDTNGTFLYNSDSRLADMTLVVYRKGKLETRLNSKGSTSFEIASREKNPYVPLLI